MISELKVHQCSNGKLCSAIYDDKDGTVVIFDTSNVALGYIPLNELVISIPRKCSKTCMTLDWFKNLFKEETK